ncbi:hypothetical protein POF50_002555 [Streptomyces sp. SL13]|uniref:Secreted protein n=1 Tax=Streptantibioticus silvisoli TaxID=2705255 RepID=A0AA90H165_9ACTN|nr:hypothetical protein [Streptantibioticus silvisoli]MDI5968237.1 hypothetical protein [Streptantibioticus silvisoli]
MRTRIAALAAAVLLAGGVLATASPASAAPAPPQGSWDHTWTTSDAAHGGTVYVEEHGDTVSLCDTAADGYAPRAEVFSEGTDGLYHARYIITASGGFASCTGYSASNGGVYDLPEGVEILVEIWLGPNVGHDGTSHYFLNDH